MNVGTLHLLVWLLLGAGLTGVVPLELRIAERLAAAVAVGFLAGPALTLVSVCCFGYAVGSILALVGLALLATGLLAAPRIGLGALWRSARPSRFELALWLLMTVGSAGVLGPLFHSHMLAERDGAYYTGGGTWGDLGLHLSLLTRFAYQERFTWDMPICEDAPLTYPFLIDFASALLVRHGWSLTSALCVPGLLLALALVQLIFFFSMRSFGSARAAILAVALFMANGSPAGFWYFWRDWRGSQEPIWSFLSHLPQNYSLLATENLRFANVVAQFLLPQRGVLLGLPAFLLIAMLLREALALPAMNPGAARERRALLLGAAFLLGLLPVAHAHTFFVVTGVWVWLATAEAWRARRVDWVCVASLGIGLLLAAPEVVWQLLGTLDPEFSRWQFGWMREKDESVFLFWMRNMGLATFLLPAGLVVLWKGRSLDRFTFHFYASLVVLFLITNVYIFQPHDFDNMKFILFSYLGVALVGGQILASLLGGGLSKVLAASAILVSLTATGSLSLLNESQATAIFSSDEKIRLAKALVEIAPPEARVLTSYLHNHFVPTLTGRRIVLGYRPWLWSYGIDTRKRERDVAMMFAGGPDALRLLKSCRVSYVAIGTSERRDFHPDEAFFAARFPVVLRSTNYVVYDVRSVGRDL